METFLRTPPDGLSLPASASARRRRECSLPCLRGAHLLARALLLVSCLLKQNGVRCSSVKGGDLEGSVSILRSEGRNGLCSRCGIGCCDA
jgi:hypothetical protein